MDGRDIAFVVSQTDINRCVSRVYHVLLLSSSLDMINALKQISANRGSVLWSRRQDETGYVKPLSETS